LLQFAVQAFAQASIIAFDPDTAGRIVVGTEAAGVIVSEDGGASWATVPGSAVIPVVSSIFFNRTGGMVIASYGRGFWRLAAGPDRLDRDDPRVNPPESRPNNDVASRAVHLGGAGEFAWIRLPNFNIPFEHYEIAFPQLNFQPAGDVDWFLINELPLFRDYPDLPGCQPELTIHFDPGVRIAVRQTDGTELASGTVASITVPSWALTARQPILVRAESANPGFAALDYGMRFEFRPPFDDACRLG
jgi:hypothetical protein